VQVLLKKEDSDKGFWERLLKDKQLEKTNVKVWVVVGCGCGCVGVVCDCLHVMREILWWRCVVPAGVS
jgi:hypothetical protein